MDPVYNLDEDCGDQDEDADDNNNDTNEDEEKEDYIRGSSAKKGFMNRNHDSLHYFLHPSSSSLTTDFYDIRIFKSIYTTLFTTLF